MLAVAGATRINNSLTVDWWDSVCIESVFQQGIGGSFRTSYINGDADLDTILAEIEASWPEGIEGEDASEIEEDMGGDMLSAGFMDRALAGEFSGTTVTMLSVFSGEDEIKLNASIEAFEEATGITINRIEGKADENSPAESTKKSRTKNKQANK